MGTTLNIMYFLNYLAYLESPHINLRKPSIINDPLDSPGCTLPQTIMHFFKFYFLCFSYNFSGSVIVSIGMGKPPSEIDS